MEIDLDLIKSKHVDTSIKPDNDLNAKKEKPNISRDPLLKKQVPDFVDDDKSFLNNDYSIQKPDGS